MFPSGVNYSAIAKPKANEEPHDQLKWLVPSGVNYRPNRVPLGMM